MVSAGTRAGVSWVGFQYSNPLSGERATQCEIFLKVGRFQRKLFTKHVRSKEFVFVEDIFNFSDSSVIPFSVTYEQAFYFNKPVIADNFL